MTIAAWDGAQPTRSICELYPKCIQDEWGAGMTSCAAYADHKSNGAVFAPACNVPACNAIENEVGRTIQTDFNPDYRQAASYARQMSDRNPAMRNFAGSVASNLAESEMKR